MKISRTFVKVFLGLFILIVFGNLITLFLGIWSLWSGLIFLIFLAFLFFLVYRKKEKGIVKFFEIIVLIFCLFLIAYIFYANFISEKNFNYFYDIGSKADYLKPYLSPTARVSEAELNESYRNLTSQLVYFDVPIPRGADKIVIQTRVQIPEKNYKIFLGARNKKDWSYLTKLVFDGIYDKINAPKIAYVEEIPFGTTIVTDRNIAPPIKKQSFEMKAFETENYLRGTHKFFVYLNDSFEFYAEKRDINWYDGEDIMNISLKNLSGAVLGQTTIEDDGIISPSKKLGKTQNGSLKVQNLKEGVYILELEGNSDVIITKLRLNTNKIVTKSIFSADSSNYLRTNDTKAEFYTETTKNSWISFNTYHSSYMQNISIANETLEIKNRSFEHYFNLSIGEYKIVLPKSDVIIKTQGFLTFSKENYYEPFEFNVVGIPKNNEELFGVDYYMTDYVLPKKDGDWRILETSFEMKDLYIMNGKLSLMFNIPHLSESINETNKDFVKIDWINVTIKKDGVF